MYSNLKSIKIKSTHRQIGVHIIVDLCVQAMTPAAAIDLAKATFDKGSAVTEFDISELSNVAAVFSTERDVHAYVSRALWKIAYSGTAGAQCVLDLGGVGTLLTAMSSWPSDAWLLYYASGALYWIAVHGGPSAQQALVTTSGVVDTLRRASAVLQANGWYDPAAKALLVLGA